jgi:hypothetical protein
MTWKLIQEGFIALSISGMAMIVTWMCIPSHDRPKAFNSGPAPEPFYKRHGSNPPPPRNYKKPSPPQNPPPSWQKNIPWQENIPEQGNLKNKKYKFMLNDDDVNKFLDSQNI